MLRPCTTRRYEMLQVASWKSGTASCHLGKTHGARIGPAMPALTSMFPQSCHFIYFFFLSHLPFEFIFPLLFLNLVSLLFWFYSLISFFSSLHSFSPFLCLFSTFFLTLFSLWRTRSFFFYTRNSCLFTVQVGYWSRMHVWWSVTCATCRYGFSLTCLIICVFFSLDWQQMRKSNPSTRKFFFFTSVNNLNSNHDYKLNPRHDSHFNPTTGFYLTHLNSTHIILHSNHILNARAFTLTHLFSWYQSFNRCINNSLCACCGLYTNDAYVFITLFLLISYLFVWNVFLTDG